MLDFFRSKKKKVEVNCPVCRREFSYQFNPNKASDCNYKYIEGAYFLYSLECDFCDAEASMVQLKSGKIDTFDNKWVKLEKEHTDEIDMVRSSILLIKERLEKKHDNKLKSQLAGLEVKLKKLERIFNLQVKKYTEFQSKWRDKWQDKLLNN